LRRGASPSRPTTASHGAPQLAVVHVLVVEIRGIGIRAGAVLIIDNAIS
jgi:hypothetical protein